MKPNLAWDNRKPRRAIIIRLGAGTWLTLLTVILLSEGYWRWALLTARGTVASFGPARLSKNFGVIKKGHHVANYEFRADPIHLACGAVCRLHQWIRR